MTRSAWFASIALALAMVGAGLIAQTGTGRQRLDFTAAEGQLVYPTGPTSPTAVEVYRNGLLQRQGATADYTQTFIQSGTRIRVTFNGTPQTTPAAGDYVTLFYYR
jgi:hypothetical protein